MQIYFFTAGVDSNELRELEDRIRSKLPKLRKQAEFFVANFRRITDHTNFQMAALSLTGCVQRIDEIVAAVQG